MPTVQELREKAKREQERKRREQNSRSSSSFSNDGFFESTNYFNTPDDSNCNSWSDSSPDTGSCSTD